MACLGGNFCRSIVKAFIRLVKNIVRFIFVTFFGAPLRACVRACVRVLTIYPFIPLGHRKYSLTEVPALATAKLAIVLGKILIVRMQVRQIVSETVLCTADGSCVWTLCVRCRSWRRCGARY